METKTPMALADFPEWRAEYDKLTELQHQLNDNAEKQRLYPPPEATISRRSRDATALLDGKVPDDGPAWAEQLLKLQNESHILAEALRIHRGRMDVLKGRLSKQICEPLVKRHRALVADIIDAVKDLARANAAEAALRRELELGDVQFIAYLRPMPYKRIGSLDDDNSDVNRYLRECKEFGFLNSSKSRAA